ncbi:MAG: O-antigen ligase family protein [Gaiellaceae bacterium]
MRSALGRGAAAPLLAAGGLLVGAAVLVGGGSSDDRLVLIGGGVILAAGLAVALLGRPRFDPVGVVFLASFAGFVGWTGFSMLWSIEPGRSWSYFDRGIAYLAFAVLGLYVGAHVRDAVRVVAVGLAVLIAVAVAWGLAGKIVPRIAPDNGRVARLHIPVSYWNAFALLIAMGLPIGVWLASRREHRPVVRAAGVLFLYASVVALLLTYSRGGIAVAVLAILASIAVARPWLEAAAALALSVPAGAAVAGWAFTRPGIAKDQRSYGERVHDGAWFGVALVLVGALVAALACLLARRELERPLGAERRRLVGRAAVVTACVATAAAVAVVAVRVDPSRLGHELASQTAPNVSQSPGRLASLSSSSRWDWWQEAWRAFRAKPLRGTGAGSFELTNYLLRKNTFYVAEPHNVALQFMSETGIIGFLLAAVAAAAALLGAVVSIRLLGGREGAAATALAIATGAYVLHALGDFDWNFVSVTAPLFFIVGVLLATGRGAARRGALPLRFTAAAVVVLAALYSFGAPWLARRDVSSAYAELGAGRAPSALDSARSAHRLDPLAVDPLLARAAAEEQLGRLNGARRSYVAAIRLQPLDWLPWFEFAGFEQAAGNPRVALRYAQRAQQLNPLGIPIGILITQLQQQVAAGG